MKDLNGKVIVITGAGSGIGRSTALAFAREGARVHLVDINFERVRELEQIIREKGVFAKAYGVDCTDLEAVRSLADAVYETEGRVDVLHNNAGVGHGAPVAKTSMEEWRWVIGINLWGVIHGIHVFTPRMIQQGGGGHIVNTASIGGLVGIPNMVPYCTSKFAIVGLSEAMGIELAPYGIHVTAICPGLISTHIIQDGRVDIPGKDKIRDVDWIFQNLGSPPETVAESVITAVREECSIKVVPSSATPFWLVKRLSTTLSQKVVGWIFSLLIS